MLLLSFGDKMLRNRPNRNKNGLCRTCLLADRNKMSIININLPIDAYCISLLYSPSCFIGENLFKKLDKPERIIAYGGLVC